MARSIRTFITVSKCGVINNAVRCCEAAQLIEFEVNTDDEDIAKAAASMAAYNYLTFCEISGENTDTESVEVHVDGAGKFEVELGDDHE